MFCGEKVGAIIWERGQKGALVETSLTEARDESTSQIFSGWPVLLVSCESP